MVVCEMTEPSPEYPLERVPKWCDDSQHIGEREYQGWIFAKGAPTGALSRLERDGEGRYVQKCDGCVSRWEASILPRRLPPDEREDVELDRPERVGDDEQAGAPF